MSLTGAKFVLVWHRVILQMPYEFYVEPIDDALILVSGLRQMGYKIEHGGALGLKGLHDGGLVLVGETFHRSSVEGINVIVRLPESRIGKAGGYIALTRLPPSDDVSQQVSQTRVALLCQKGRLGLGRKTSKALHVGAPVIPDVLNNLLTRKAGHTHLQALNHGPGVAMH